MRGRHKHLDLHEGVDEVAGARIDSATASPRLALPEFTFRTLSQIIAPAGEIGDKLASDFHGFAGGEFPAYLADLSSK
jgi:hypothetical protein